MQNGRARNNYTVVKKHVLNYLFFFCLGTSLKKNVVGKQWAKRMNM